MLVYHDHFSKNENITGWISDCPVGPSFLCLGSPPSWDLNGGMAFIFQQDGRVAPYLVSQLSSSVNSSRPSPPCPIASFSLFLHLFTRSYPHRLYWSQDVYLSFSYSFLSHIFIDQSQPLPPVTIQWKTSVEFSSNVWVSHLLEKQLFGFSPADKQTQILCWPEERSCAPQ